MQILEETRPSSNGQSADGDWAALLGAMVNLRAGNANVRLPADWTGVPGKVADAFNDIAALNERMARELKLERQVRFLGYQDNAARLLPMARIYAHAAMIENMPLDPSPRRAAFDCLTSEWAGPP